MNLCARQTQSKMDKFPEPVQEQNSTTSAMRLYERGPNSTGYVNLKKLIDQYLVDIRLKKDEIVHILPIVSDFFDTFMRKLKDKDNKNNWSVFKSGSYFEGTKIGRLNDFDFMLIPSIKARAVFNASYPPGYCKLKLLPGNNSQLYKDIVDAENFISPTKFRNYTFSLFKNCSENWNVTRIIKDLDSPAYTARYDHGLAGVASVDVDLVPSIEVSGWPSVAEEISPSWLKHNRKKVSERCMKKFHVVTKTCPFKNAPEREMLWRLSFSWAEKLLISYANNATKNGSLNDILRLLKWFLEKAKKENNGLVKKLASNHLKMYMLHQYDEWSYEAPSGVTDRLIDAASHLLVVLSRDPGKGYPAIRNYFLKDHNVIKHIPQTELDLFRSTIRKILSSP